MRDAGGELADRFELLRLAELLLQLQLRGDIALDGNVTGDFAGPRFADRRDRLPLVVDRAVFLPVAHLPGPDLPAADRGPQVLVKLIIVFAALE